MFSFGSNTTQPANNPPTFGFGNQNAQTMTQTGGIHFGNSTSQPTTGGFAFGQSTTTQQQPSLFSSSTNQPATQANTGMFGQAATTQPSTGVFGQPAPATNTFGQSTSTPFGQPATTQANTGIFGQPATSQPATGLFNQPATSQPATGLFGQPSTQPATGLFGQPTTTQSATAGLFGQPATTQSATAGLFGQPAATGLFGQPATSQPATTGMFGQPATSQPATTGMFGQPATTQTGTLFGQQPPTGGTLFGQQQPATGTLFGQQPQQAATATLFGQQPQQQPAQTTPPEDPVEQAKVLYKKWEAASNTCQFRHFFFNFVGGPQQAQQYRCPPTMDPNLWALAQQANPDPNYLVPVLASGWGDLSKRMDAQDKELIEQEKMMNTMKERLDKLRDSHQLTTTVRLEKLVRDLDTIQNRVISLAKEVHVLRCKGLPIQPHEEVLKAKLEALQAVLKRGSAFRGRVEELLAQLQRLKAMYQVDGVDGEAIVIRHVPQPSPPDLDAWLKVLADQTNGLRLLIDTVKEDELDVDKMKEGYPSQKGPMVENFLVAGATTSGPNLVQQRIM